MGKRLLQPVKSSATRDIEEYRSLVGDTLLAQIHQAAAPLAGKRVLMINATAKGGGVAEILQSELPLLRQLGVEAEWQVLTAPPEFYELTKTVHNALQGDAQGLSEPEWQRYETINRELAAEIDPDAWDLIVVHDPQPAAARQYTPVGKARWAWRCHIDSSQPNETVGSRLAHYLEAYNGAIFTLPEYVLPGLKAQTAIIPVAIDPLSAKNRPLEPATAAAMLAKFGIDPASPLVTQVSRFDPWKDPLGVIEAWQLASQHVPKLQLALVGDSSPDDPEGKRILQTIMAAAEGQDNLFVIADRADDRAVKSFYTHSDVVIQKSLREGFGLTVTEALWSSTPVVGGNVGGIRLQVIDGRTGYLVQSPREAGERLVQLLTHPKQAREMGAAGREWVRTRFLLPSMLLADLKFWGRLLETQPQ